MYSSSSRVHVRHRASILCLAWFLAFVSLAKAQISIVDSGAAGNQVNLGAAYTQSFDSLANTTTAPVPWVNNGTLPGWYAYRQSSGAATSYSPSQRTSPFGSFGLLGNPDRALGSSLNGGVVDTLHFGVQFNNNTSSLISGFDISFDGEQWFYGDSFPGVTESLDFSYQVFDAGLGGFSVSSGWTSVSALTFVSPIDNDSESAVNQALDGNLPANREAGIESFIGLVLSPGQ